jgi:hypothetical protein
MVEVNVRVVVSFSTLEITEVIKLVEVALDRLVLVLVLVSTVWDVLVDSTVKLEAGAVETRDTVFVEMLRQLHAELTRLAGAPDKQLGVGMKPAAVARSLMTCSAVTVVFTTSVLVLVEVDDVVVFVVLVSSLVDVMRSVASFFLVEVWTVVVAFDTVVTGVNVLV